MKEEGVIENLAHSAIMRGQRLKFARKLAKLTLREMSDDSSINYNTLCGWECGKHSGLTEKGAIKIVERLGKEGVQCSIEWLLYDVGKLPSRCNVIQNSITLRPSPTIVTDTTITNPSNKDFLSSQIQSIKTNFPNTMEVMIHDNAMSPSYNYGDYVAGLPLPLNKLSTATGRTVITKLSDGRLLCRILVVEPHSEVLSLTTINKAHHEAILYNINIVEWALVLCHFKSEFL